ncbi:MAG: AAA family ATPase [Crenarchaeota archaeon]|nr:AAA family ATPase [Thermoproteota archaeon]
MMRVPFVDRVGEIEFLSELAERGSPFPLFIYGPEGCGKTRLLEELRDSLKAQGFLVLYLDAEESDLGRALRGSSRELVDAVASVVSGFEGALGKVVALAIAKVVEAYEHRYRFRGKRVVIAVDEVVEGIGLGEVERYAKVLHDLARDVVELGAESILIIATTSEEASRDALSRHSYLHLSYLWNLGEEAFEELARALGAPRDAVEELYELTSGNPRALIDIATRSWRTGSWLEAIYAERIRPLRYERIVAAHVDDLERIVEDPDNASNADPELRKLLIERNLITYLGNPLTPSTRPRPSAEMGIGNEFAWQLNAYRLLIKDRLIPQLHRE